MANKNRGLRVGNYRVTPLGLGVLAAILLIIIGLIVLNVVKPRVAADESASVPAAVATQEAAVVNEAPATPVPTAAPTPTPTPAPTPEPREATIRALGEIAVQTNVLNAAKQEDGSYDFAPMFTYISDVMGDADYTIADVEGSMGGTVDPAGETLLNTPASIIAALKECGVDMLNLANDHALDGYLSDLTAPIENCKNEGMEYVGAAATQEEKDTPKVIDIGGIKVGFLAYTESLNGMEQKSSADAVKYGVNLISSAVNPKKEAQALRDAGAEVVVCCVSWGEMLNRSTTEMQKQIAKALVVAGVDVIIGYNPHVIQPAMWIEMKDKNGNVAQRTLCLCSAGNFLSDCRQQYGDSGIVFDFTLRDNETRTGVEVVEPKYIPTYVWRIDNEDGSFDYYTLPVNEFKDSQPAEMNYAQVSRVKEVWAEAQSIMGTDVAACVE